MPKFRFSIVESGGQSRSGTIEAASEAEAAFSLRQRGLQPTQISAVDAADSDWDRSRESRSPFAGVPNLARRGLAGIPLSGPLPLILSGAALLFAIVALIVAITRDPLGRGVSHYDFSTPEGATRSMVEIDFNSDIRARMELDRLQQGDPESVWQTFEVKKVAKFQDRKIVFVTYREAGRTRKRLFTFEREPSSKLWIPRYVSPYKVGDFDEQLGKEMRAWTEADED